MPGRSPDDAASTPRASSGAPTIQGGALAEVDAPPQIHRQQGVFAGAHRVWFLARVMNQSSRWARPPGGIALLPLGRPRQRQVELFGLMAMRRIERVRSQH